MTMKYSPRAYDDFMKLAYPERPAEKDKVEASRDLRRLSEEGKRVRPNNYQSQLTSAKIPLLDQYKIVRNTAQRKITIRNPETGATRIEEKDISLLFVIHEDEVIRVISKDQES